MAKDLNERQKHILYFILKANEEVNMNDLVRRLAVSRRTIQRDISAVQTYLNAFDLKLLHAQGITIDGETVDIEKMLLSTGKLPDSVALTPRGRELHVAMDLLMEQGPSKLGYFGRQLNVTSASLSQNLDDIEDWLNAHGLSLIRRRGYGVEVQGNEELRREAIAELVWEQVSVPDLMAMLRQDESKEPKSPVVTWFAKWFQAEEIAEARSVIVEELAGYNPPLDEAALYGFMLHVLLMVARIKNGAALDTNGTTPDDSQELKICTRILERFMLEALENSGEARYLAKHLRGAKVLMTEENRILPLHITSMDLAYRMVKHLAATLRMPLEGDRDLIVGMAQHLEPAIHRMTSGLLIRNPLLDEIKRRYRSLFDAMRSASTKVLEPYGLSVPDAEIGYLTMHLGASYERQRAEHVWRARVVCPNGISSAELLASRFKKEFPQVQIVSLGALDERQDTACDFIASTVPLDETDLPVVTVSPFLTEEERDKVGRLLASLESSGSPFRNRGLEQPPSNDEKASRALDISDRVEIRHVHARNIGDVINQIADDLLTAGNSTNKEELLQAIWERERLGSIVLPGKRLSVLHARTSALSRCQVSIYRFAHPFTISGVAKTEEIIDTVLVLLALDNESPNTIRLLGRLSSSLVMEEDMVEALRQAPLSEVQQRIRQAMTQTEE